MGDGQGEILEGLARALCTVGHDAAHQDHAVGQAAQGDSRVHVRQRGRQRDGVSARGDGLEAEQLKQRSHEDVHARAEDVCAQELVAMRAVALGHPVEQPYRRLQRHLQLSRYHLEPGDDEHPQQYRRQQQCAHHHQRGYVRRVHVLQPEQADAVRPVEHCVTHGLLHRLRLPVSGNQQRTGQ